MTPQIKVSVIIPTAKRATMLDKTLAALAFQTRRPYQVIVVSNGKRDKETDAVVLSYNKRLPISLYHEEIPGPSHARNTGLVHARGTIIAFLDDDCVTAKNWLLEIEQTYKKKTIDRVIFQEKWTHVFPNTNIITELFHFRRLQQKHKMKKAFGYSVTNEAHAGCCFMKRSVLAAFPYVFDERLFPFIGEEVDFSARAQLLGIPILLHPRVRVTHYKQSAKSVLRTFHHVFLYGRALGIIQEKYKVSTTIAKVFAKETGAIQQVKFPVYTGNLSGFFKRYREKPLWWKIAAELFEIGRSFMIRLGAVYGKLWWRVWGHAS